MTSMENSLQAFHGMLRQGMFMEIWESTNPPMRHPYRLESLNQFEEGVLERFQGQADILMPLLYMYAFYLGETIVQERPEAEWVYPEDANPINCTVTINAPDESSRQELSPFSVLCKVVLGETQGLHSMVESVLFLSEQHHILSQMEVGKPLAMPNGVTVTLRAIQESDA